jgi:hypothetical protein
MTAILAAVQNDGRSAAAPLLQLLIGFVLVMMTASATTRRSMNELLVKVERPKIGLTFLLGAGPMWSAACGFSRPHVLLLSQAGHGRRLSIEISSVVGGGPAKLQ